MAETKRKTTQKKTTAKRKTTQKKTTAPKADAKVQTTDEPQSGPVRVPAGGIDPRLVEQRDKQREAEKDVRYAHASEPATLDPKLAKIREQTIEQEKKLANRSLTEPPVRTSR